MLIRPARPDDHAQWLPLWKGYQTFYRTDLPEHVYAAAEAGASRVHWLTHETNHDAMQLYDRIASKSGFVQYRHLIG